MAPVSFLEVVTNVTSVGARFLLRQLLCRQELPFDIALNGYGESIDRELCFCFCIALLLGTTSAKISGCISNSKSLLGFVMQTLHPVLLARLENSTVGEWRSQILYALRFFSNPLAKQKQMDGGSAKTGPIHRMARHLHAITKTACTLSFKPPANHKQMDGESATGPIRR